MQYGKLRSYCGSRLVKFFLWIFIDLKDTFETGESFFVIFFILIFFTTVSEIQIREREDGNNSDTSPVQVSNSVDDRSGQPDETTIERGNSLDSEIPKWLQEFRENLVDDEIPVHGGSHASFSHEASLDRQQRDVRIWVSTVFILIFLKTEIARSVKGQKLQGLHAEDAMAKPYLEL